MRKIKKILYDVKRTSANTTYVSLDSSDKELIITSMISVMCYMQELSASKLQDIKDFVNWYNRPNKKYGHNKLGKYNSPQTYLSGTMNNLQFGTQQDFSFTQLENLQDILNTSIDVIDAIEEEYKIKLQNNVIFEKIWLQENLWQNP
jgi:hypothetical protein